jgi:UDP-glucose 4-epimerase
MRILVTGGAGYIGSACVHKLIKKHEVVVVDNLSKGKKEFVDPKAEFYKLDLADRGALQKAFSKKIDAVIHFAAYKAVEESMEDAVKYSDNITGTINLLDMMVKKGVRKIIFSSSAAVYGMPKKEIVDEDAETKPINYYGYTKLACEQIIGWYSNIHAIEHVNLRYFNVAGDSGLGYVDPDAKNIVPILMEVLSGKRKKLTVFGNDYKTRDGTCIRDYIDVNDLVDAHILALDVEGSHVINLGTSKGSSVLELINATEKVTKKKLAFHFRTEEAR